MTAFDRHLRPKPLLDIHYPDEMRAQFGGTLRYHVALDRIPELLTNLDLVR